ncbi:MAG TPA: hypothetical protein VIV40_01330 [Kofleriaceae bacterium]
MRKHVMIDLKTGETKIEDMREEVSPREALEQIMHDCPECRAARARGEVPTFGDGDPLPVLRDVIRDRRPRWRDIKRRVRR